jgi:hypothetical protein
MDETQRAAERHMADQEQSWWAIRMVVELTSVDGTFSQFEDRIVIVRAGDATEAEERGETLAADYEKTSSWKVRKIVDVSEISEPELADGTEIYSAFIDSEWADVLMKGGDSPLAKWKRQNPDKDIGDATVGDVIDAWENAGNEA